MTKLEKDQKEKLDKIEKEAAFNGPTRQVEHYLKKLRKIVKLCREEGKWIGGLEFFL